MPSVTFTHHAVDRYIERVRPALDRTQALRELIALAAAAEIVDSPPAWYLNEQPVDVFLTFGDVVFPVQRDGQRLVAVTCVTRGLASVAWRQARNEWHAQQRARRRALRVKDKRAGRDHRQRGKVRAEGAGL